MSTRKPQRGGWSGGPVPRDNNLLIATVALTLGLGAVLLMVWFTTGGGR